MSTPQLRILAICSWLLALCVLMPAAAAYEDYTLFRDGHHVMATVVASDAHDNGHVTVTLRWQGRSGSNDWHHDATGPASRFAPGSTVGLLLHRNTSQPILASALDDQLPSPWYVVAALAFVAGGVLLWRVPTRAAARRAQRTDPAEAIVEAAARTRNTCLGYGLGLVPTGLGFAALPLLDPSGTGALVMIELLAGVTLVSGVVLLRRAWQLRDPRHNAIVDLVLARPQDLASYELHELRIRGISTLSLRLRDHDGRRAQLTMVHEDVDAVFGELARRAPGARRLGALAIAALVAIAGCGGHAAAPVSAHADDDLMAALESWEVEVEGGGTASIVEDSLGGKSEVQLADLDCTQAACDADGGTLHVEGEPAARIFAALRGRAPSLCDAQACHARNVACDRHPVDVDVDLEPKTTSCTLEAR